MGLPQHVVAGFYFLLIGLWQLFNHIKLHTLHPNSYTSLTWFPTPKSKYLELILTMVCSFGFMVEELVIRPYGYQLLDPSDGSVPTNHLPFIEHGSTLFAFFVYAAFAVVLDLTRDRVQHGLTLILNAFAYTQMLFLLHFHTADHVGPEGRYHLLLQLIVLVCVATTLIGIGLPRSFLVGFVRCLSVVSQGVWLVFMGIMLWTPGLVAKGCVLHRDERGQKSITCFHDQDALRRAKSLVNLQFSWFLSGIFIFGMSLYLFLGKIYGQKVEYISLRIVEEELDKVEAKHMEEIQITV